MERANVKKHEGLLTKKSYLSTWSGIVSMGKFGEEGKKAPFESIQGRIVSTNKEYSSSSPQVRCNRWKEGARAMLP